MEEKLKECIVITTMPVKWGEMDAFQHVNNTVYFRYFEDVRLDFFRQVGIDAYMKAHSIGPILASTQCRFKVPLSYPDTVHIGTYVTDIQKDRFTMKYLVYSENAKRIAAQGEGLIVSYDYKENKKADIPQIWLDNLKELEAKL